MIFLGLVCFFGRWVMFFMVFFICMDGIWNVCGVFVSVFGLGFVKINLFVLVVVVFFWGLCGMFCFIVYW